MCNLYTMRKSMAEVAAHFGVKALAFSNATGEALPGAPGMVVREEAGERVMQSMTWGFPLRLKTMSATAKPRPVNNIADLNKPMWKGLAAKSRWRCLIPFTAFAEPEGPKGVKTRTWFNVKDQPIAAWAGLWRESAEWGPVYAGVMTDCNDAIRPVHDRMPVLLMPDEYDAWLNGTFDDAVAFQLRCFPDELIESTRTDELWVPRNGGEVTHFRQVFQGHWRILIGDQIADEAYDLAIEGDRATFTGEDGIVEYAGTSAAASFPSGASLDLNSGLVAVNPKPVTGEQQSFPVVLRHDGALEAFGFMFRPEAVPGGAAAPGEG